MLRSLSVLAVATLRAVLVACSLSTAHPPV
jgi:hypothetical protein